jgi:hypothetical protein
MKTLALLSLLLAASPGLAKSKHAPLPSELVDAKSLYVVNNTGYQQALDTAYTQFQKWGRFSVVSKKDAADIVVVFDHQSGLREGTTIGFTQMNVFLKGQDEPAFEATERYRSVLFGGSSIKACVGDFKHRMESK